MRIVWEDDEAVPEAMRKALAATPRHHRQRHVIILDRGDATDTEVMDALRAFERAHDPWSRMLAGDE